ncbi:MAG: hypothetical protein V4760_10050, partial [Bdellovibrionota bacterium]
MRKILFGLGFCLVAIVLLYASGVQPSADDAGGKYDELARVKTMAVNLAQSLRSGALRKPPTGVETPGTDATEADVEIAATLAKEEPALAKRDVPMTAKETMQAALALQR